jgi:MraZ protein
MFFGTYTHSVDPAGRFILPKKFRNNLGDNFLITKGVGCLWIFTQEYLTGRLEESVDLLGKNPLRGLFDPNVTRWTRHVFAEMVATNDDSQNRVPLIQEHRQYAGIQDEVAIVGCGQLIELWNPKALDEYRRQVDADPDGLVASAEAVKPVLSHLLEENADAGIPSAGSQE